MRVTSIEARREAILIHLAGESDAILQVAMSPVFDLEYATAKVEEHRPIAAASGMQLRLDRFADGQDRMYCRFRVTDERDMNLDGPQFVTDLSDVAAWSYPYPQASTIKGLQVKVMEDGLGLHLGHVALNMNLPCIIQALPGADSIPFALDGRKFYFSRSYMEAMDRKIRAFSEQGAVVNLIVINRREWQGVWGDPALDPILVHPQLHPEGIVGAFSVAREEPWLYYRACIAFLAQRYMRPDAQYGRACGLIIGNEVNSQWIYSNAGEMPQEEFVRQYHIALRTAWYAAKSVYANARVYVSLDHCWSIANGENSLRYYPGRDFLERLHAIGKEDGDFGWDLAYHPFPQDLTRADFWNDHLALHDFDAGKITFRNIEQLPAFLAQEKYLYSGRPRHIILSEQGLCAGMTPETEQLQADALVLAYRKLRSLPQIEAFIYHSHIDEKHEGLYLGLLDEHGRKRPAYACFEKLDGPEADALYQEALARLQGTDPNVLAKIKL